MKTQTIDIKYAKALARAEKARHAAIDTASDLLLQARTPEAEAEAATHLIGVADQAEIDFRNYVSRAADKIAQGDRELELLRAAFGDRGAGA